MPATWKCPDTGTEFPTGALPTPRHRLLGSVPFTPIAAAPAQFAYVPKYRSYFYNDRFGICVSAEEAFAKTCVNPEIFNSQAIVDRLADVCKAWAQSHGVLNGASLDEVLDWMREKGFQIDAQLFNDGPKLGVDYGNESVLQAAIAQGPVKLAIGASALPGGAGSQDGTYALTARNYSSDHSTTLCGYGTAEYCYQQLGLPVPSACAGRFGYLHYTWAHIGFVTIEWIKGATDEAWVRQPTTVGVPPLAPPTPPGPGPGPGPIPVAFPISLTFAGVPEAGGKYIATKMPEA